MLRELLKKLVEITDKLPEKSQRHCRINFQVDYFRSFQRVATGIPNRATVGIPEEIMKTFKAIGQIPLQNK